MTNHIDTTRPLFVSLGRVTKKSRGIDNEGDEAEFYRFVELTTPGYRRQRVRFGGPEDFDGVRVVRSRSVVEFPRVDSLTVTHFVCWTKRNGGGVVSMGEIERTDRTASHGTYFPVGLLMIGVPDG